MKHTLDSRVDFHTGVQVTKGSVNSWHKKVLEFLQSNPNDSHYYLRSGNGMVVGLRQQDGDIKIIEISTGYVEFIYEPERTE